MSDPLDLPDPLAPAPAPTVRESPGIGRVVGRVVLAIVLGVAVAALGTVTHRTLWHGLPLGLVIALALTVSMSLMCRAWSGLVTLAAAAAGWIVAIQILSAPGAGGDVLIIDPRVAIPAAWASIAWSWGGIILIGVVAFLPGRWFARR